MKKMFFAAVATFAMVSISSMFAMNAKLYNAPDGLANDTTADTTVTVPSDEPASGNTAGDGMFIISSNDTTDVPTTATDTPDTPAPDSTSTSSSIGNATE